MRITFLKQMQKSLFKERYRESKETPWDRENQLQRRTDASPASLFGLVRLWDSQNGQSCCLKVASRPGQHILEARSTMALQETGRQARKAC